MMSAMSEDDGDGRAHWQNAEEGSRAAAQWALKLLGGFENRGSIGAARELDEYLATLNYDQRLVFLVQLVNLVARMGVAAPDVATLKVRLREQASGAAS